MCDLMPASQPAEKIGKMKKLRRTLSESFRSIAFKKEDSGFDEFTMKRRPLLYVINFLLPILFFLSLDLASSFIADHRGEKLGFKVTVLLAISVLLLILNDILPSMSNKTPLIATFCIVIFGMMLLSLLETILVTYLMEKDSATLEKLRLRDDWEDKHDKAETVKCNTEEKRQTCCSCICKMTDGEKQHESLPAAEERQGCLQTQNGQPADCEEVFAEL